MCERFEKGQPSPPACVTRMYLKSVDLSTSWQLPYAVGPLNLLRPASRQPHPAANGRVDTPRRLGGGLQLGLGLPLNGYEKVAPGANLRICPLCPLA